jgi:hypothetical protein
MISFITSSILSIIKFLFLLLRNLPKSSADKNEKKTEEIQPEKIEPQTISSFNAFEQVMLVEKEVETFEGRIKNAGTLQEKWDILIEYSDNEKEKEIMKRLRDVEN